MGGNDPGATLAETLGRPVRYEPASLGDTRDTLTSSGLQPYQVAHTVSMFSNINAGLLERQDSDLPALLEAPPRPVLGMIARVVKAGSFTTRSVTTGPGH